MWRRGYSLIEVMLAMVLGALILGVAYESLFVIGKAFGRAQQRVDMQSAGMLVLGHLTSDLRRSCDNTLTVVTGGSVVVPVCLSFRLPDDSQPASVSFQNSTIYVQYFLRSGTLFRRVLPSTNPSNMDHARFMATALPTLCVASTPQDQVLLPQVTSFNVQPGTFPNTTSRDVTLSFQVVLENTDQTPNISEVVQTSTTLRNQLQ